MALQGLNDRHFGCLLQGVWLHLGYMSWIFVCSVLLCGHLALHLPMLLEKVALCAERDRQPDTVMCFQIQVPNSMLHCEAEPSGLRKES